MNLIESIKKLFGRVPLDETEAQQVEESAVRYSDDSRVNFTALIARKLATLATAESTVEIIGDGARAELMREYAGRVWKQASDFTARMLGEGGVILVPYVAEGKLFFSVVSQSQMTVTRIIGDEIRGASFLCERFVRNRSVYLRFVDYELEANGAHTIRNRAMCDDRPCSLETVSEWAELPPEITISGCERLLFAFMKSPQGSANGRFYGAPITAGCDYLLDQITDTLEQIDKEYSLKRVFIGADSRLFKDNGASLPKSGVFKALTDTSQSGGMFSVFDPSIRDTAYYHRLSALFELLEKRIGVSRGILTEPTSRGATATEIKAALYDTYAMVDAIRRELESGLDALFYAAGVLSNAYKLAGVGEFDKQVHWSYALIESSSETFNQLYQAQMIGAVDAAEVRNYVKGDETLDESREAVQAIKAGNGVSLENALIETEKEYF